MPSRPRSKKPRVPAGDARRGLAALEDYPPVAETQAGSATRRLYRRIQDSLGVPFVAPVFQMLANRPDFLAPGWDLVEPAVRGARFQRAADELRAAAPFRTIPSGAGLDAVAGIDLDEVRSVTDTFLDAAPKLLLAVELLDQTLARAPKKPPAVVAQARDASPQLHAPVALPDAQRLNAPTRELLDDIRETHGHPIVAPYFLALARWPLVLGPLWGELKPTVNSGPYVAQRRQLVDRAGDLARPFRVGGVDLDEAGIDPESAGALRDLLAVFRERLIPDLLMDIALLKEILDGPQGAGTLERPRGRAAPPSRRRPSASRRRERAERPQPAAAAQE